MNIFVSLLPFHSNPNYAIFLLVQIFTANKFILFPFEMAAVGVLNAARKDPAQCINACVYRHTSIVMFTMSLQSIVLQGEVYMILLFPVIWKKKTS